MEEKTQTEQVQVQSEQTAPKGAEAPAKKKKKKKSLFLPILLIVLVAIAAIGVTLYPMISNVMAEHNKSVIQTSYEETLKVLDTSERDQLLADAQAYNERLINSEYQPYSREAIIEATEGYEDMLNVQHNGIMGYLVVPKIDIELPILHDTTDESLNHGVGHVIGSTLPIGGEGTHSILSAHSGMAGQKMFTDLDRLTEGDVFYIRMLGDTLAYQVTEINVVLPEDVSKLELIPDRDRCTLVTCTPYGVNTHRLLVHGDRIEYEEAKIIEEEQQEQLENGPIESTWTEMYMKGVIYGAIAVAAIIFVALIIGLVSKCRKKRRAKDSEKK